MGTSLLVKIEGSAIRILARVLFSLPDGLLTKVFGSPPEVAAGLRADAWALCRLTDLAESKAAATDPVAMRAETEMLAKAVSDPTVFPVETKDFDLGADGSHLPARLYRPAAAVEDGSLLVYFHGGGWVVGSIESHDWSLRRMAHLAGTRILAVDYRLGPEQMFPAAPDDALTAWNAVTAQPSRFGADPDLIAVGGDSAGGNLAAVLCQDLRAAGRPQPAFQLLIYPVVEIGGTWPSREMFATGYYLTRSRMDWYDSHYVASEDGRDVRASPILADDLSGLAPAYVTTALADPLRDEGEAYARRLGEAGVKVTLDRFPLVHAWFNQTVSRSSRAAHEVLAGRVRALFQSARTDDLS
ncbi:MAG: alpha/beta hydrolase [Solirubrobacterales bacterium]